MNPEADIIIVGAGSAGSALAGRLSEDPSLSIILLEAGGRAWSPWLHIPIGYGKTMVDPRVNWQFTTDPVPTAGGRRIYWPRGKVLGGSSAINGLLYIRGQAQDYDHWAQLGNMGWSYDDVLPYFRRSEGFQAGASDYHGDKGPLTVSALREKNPICEAFIASGVAAGLPLNADFNGPAQDGIGYYHNTTRNALRVSAARAYLGPARKRDNLRVVTQALARRVILDGRRAIGVEASVAGQVRKFRARREVILCGGAIGSPHLLLLSGIGPGAQLSGLGLQVAHDLPGVGENLQDHYGAVLTYKSRLPLTVNDIMQSRLRMLRAGLQYLLLRRGPLTISAAQVGAFVRSHPDLSAPDIQFLFQAFSHDEFEAGLHPFSGFANVVHPLRPHSRGRLALRSADPSEVPAMHPNYMASDEDCRIIVSSVRAARRVAAVGPVTDHIEAELAPGPDVQTDDEIVAYARQTGVSIAHQSGTCKMGSDPMAVVDARLRVHGMAGLRVVDAAIMPTLISGNTNAPTIMIAEKAADMIRADLGAVQ